jgi:anti-sigma B factor antagonist
MSEDKFSLSVEEKNDVVILKTNGYINNVAGEQIAESCYKKIDGGTKKFLLDLEKSSIVNSIGVSIIIEIIEKLQEVDGHIGYYNLAPIVAKTFKIMGLVQYSTIYDSEEEALSDMESK